VAARDANAALALHVELLTTASGDMTTWAVSDLIFACADVSQPGVKQLIRLGL
jgi:protein transport protein SEC31